MSLREQRTFEDSDMIILINLNIRFDCLNFGTRLISLSKYSNNYVSSPTQTESPSLLTYCAPNEGYARISLDVLIAITSLTRLYARQIVPAIQKNLQCT